MNNNNRSTSSLIVTFEVIRDICDLMIQTEQEDSSVANFLSVFDYTSYNSILDPILSVFDWMVVEPRRFWEVVKRVPRMYYEYYLLGNLIMA